jgi:aerobic-type carbon monoxide dehydrogenase small subunit (CoxS/CutS family)
MASLNVNGKNYIVNVPDDMLLLWVLRDNLKLAKQ